MSFITKAAIRAVRLRKAVDFKLDEYELSLKIMPLSGDATLEAIDLQAQVTAGTKKQRDMFRFVVKNALARTDGTPLTEEESDLVLEAASLREMKSLLEAFNKLPLALEEKKKRAGKV
jgi:hypothetical protein